MNLRGIGIGFKYRRGRKTKHLAVHFFVSKKRSPSSISKSDRIPNQWNGVATDVIEIGETNAIGLRDRERPALLGCSIGVQRGIDATLGTLGAIVERTTNQGERLILTAGHVLTNWEQFPRGTSVLQPATIDGGEGPRDVIARLVAVAPLVSRGRGPFDAALAELVDVRAVVTEFGVHAPPVTSLLPVEPREHMSVHKVGMATGLTHGIVLSIGAAIEVNTGEPAIGAVRLEDQFLIKDVRRSFSDVGDSGAIVFATGEQSPVGLLVARSSRGYSIANRLSTLLRFFEARLVA